MTQPHNGWLITGGTGFLGRALARRLLDAKGGGIGPLPAYESERICIYSRGEASQAAMRAELNDDPRLRWFIGDVRDRERLTRAFESVHMVVHAAALKRVEVGTYNPTEMVKTNILGSQNVIEAAIDAGVARVVFVSTDKAVEPLNCYGATKLVAEKLFLGAQLLAPYGPKFTAVRYGNVAGSTGSVIPTWRSALEQGRPITVRNPNATRFWITADQAVELVVKAAGLASGSLLVPELPAYRVEDLLMAMLPEDVTQAPVDFAVSQGMEPGEKPHESLLGADEPGGPRRSCDARRMSVAELRAEIAKL